MSASRPDPRSAVAPAPPAPGQGAAASSPFAQVPDPRAYVPRPACEEALASLVRALDDGARVAFVEGPSGIGKSLLLRVLETRLDARFEVVRLPLAGASFDELAAIALSGLDQRSAARVALTLEDAARRLRTVGRVLVVTVDDAARLSSDAAEALGRALRAGRGALRAVLAVETSAPRPRLPGGTRTVRLATPMTGAESARYVEARLARSPEPRLHRAFSPAAVAELHSRSGGVPGALHALAEPLVEAALPFGPSSAAAAAPFVRELAAAPPTRGYLPREETEVLLEAILRELRTGRRAQLVRGPSGVGKTTLLRELRARLREPFQPVDVFYAKLDPPDFFAWALHQIGAPPPVRAPELELREIAERLARVAGTLVLLVDEAQSLPADTTARLAEVLARSEGGVRVVAALDSDADPRALRAWPDLLEHRFEQPLSPAECATWLEWRLADAPEALRTRFGPALVRNLYRASHGNPRALIRLASELEREAEGTAPVGCEVPAPATAVSRDEAAPSAAPPLAPRAGASPAEPAPATPRLSPMLVHFVAPLALGAGVPLALFALWLWLAPVFSAPPSPVRLAIAAPPGTAIAVDGRLLGEIPDGGLELAPGVYRVRAVLPDGTALERRVAVGPRGATVTFP